MYDMHYDLLTILYYNFEKNSINIPNLKQNLVNMYNNNIKGGVINLYFMSELEMLKELDITKEELKDIIKMFQASIKYLETLKSENVIPINIDYIFSIEGCDYLNVNDLDYLYKLGLRSIIPVWNNENKFGSGCKTNKGLTDLGIELIEKAIKLGMIIDVSHANENTFYDIIKIIKKHKNVNLIASHSNVKTLCDRKRNMTDEQLRILNYNKGYIGLFTNGNFVSNNNNLLTYEQRIENFMKHLDYLINIIKFDTQRIFISTDDMNFSKDITYHNSETYPLEKIYVKLHQEITKIYGKNMADDILTNNPKKLILKVK